MEAYSGFASVYDLFMDNIPYDDWCEYLVGLLEEYGVNEGLVLDMGCGTGNITTRLADKGYDMIGIDYSQEMLSIAMEKLEQDKEQNNTDRNILYLLQDMREFELYGTVAAAVSICDSMNYIMSEDELREVFHLVNNYLDTEGIFIFDLNTEYKYREILGERTIAENREDCSFIWDNYYYDEEKVNEYDLTIYARHMQEEDSEEESHNLFERFDETHYQKAYSLETIKRLLEEAGMEFVTAYDAFTKKPVREDSERIYIVAKEKHQDNKYYTE